MIIRWGYDFVVRSAMHEDPAEIKPGCFRYEVFIEKLRKYSEKFRKDLSIIFLSGSHIYF